MKKIKFNKQICLAAVAFALLAGVCVNEAMAYFTTYATASGNVKMELEFTETLPNDRVENKVKTVSVTNDKDYACFVRLKVFVGDAFKDAISFVPGAWELKDGYYTYNQILEPGSTTSDFKVDLTQAFAIVPEAGDLDEFNVIIIQECAPVLYNEETGAAYVDWAGSDYVIYND